MKLPPYCGPMSLKVLILENRKCEVDLLIDELRLAGFDPDAQHVTNEQLLESFGSIVGKPAGVSVPPDAGLCISEAR